MFFALLKKSLIIITMVDISYILTKPSHVDAEKSN